MTKGQNKADRCNGQGGKGNTTEQNRCQGAPGRCRTGQGQRCGKGRRQARQAR